MCLLALGGCNSISPEERAVRAGRVIITPDNPTKPKRVRVELYDTPYADQFDKSIPVRERIRLGMRRFAEERIPPTGYCPNGFTGPELVMASAADPDQAFFFVDCVE